LTIYFRTAKNAPSVYFDHANPNSVVNGDSEEIVVASCDRRENGLPHITYHSGSPENITPQDPGIRQQVCRILERVRRFPQKRTALRISLTTRHNPRVAVCGCSSFVPRIDVSSFFP
jgi:hypothetical protein